MLNIAAVQEHVKQFAEENANTLMTAGAVVGTVATGVLAGRAGIKAERVIREAQEERFRNKEVAVVDGDPDILLSGREKMMVAGLYFLPPFLTGAATVGAIIMANRMNANKAAALAAAYGLSQKQLEEYKTKVSEHLTGPKNQKIKDEIAQDAVTKTPGSSQVIVVSGEVLCLDKPTGRYFTSTMENIRKAENAVNAEIIQHEYASAQMFYDELELPATSWANSVGWNTGNMCELEISSALTNDDKPCLVIDFAKMPKVDWHTNDYN